ncbi:MAG TPA: ABC transporter substrate-binding protein [Anaerolineae bacterium]|nr:ABC transporter substrate-binding protein [Anaerolineae bacterium]
MSRRFTRREVLRLGGLGSAMALLAACQAKVVEKIVEKEVTKVVKEVVRETEIVKEVVKETVIVAGTPQVVEKEVTRVVEKEVAPAVEQVLRIVTGSSGAASFAFNCLVCGSDLQSWMPFLYTPPLYFDKDLKLQFGVFDSYESNDDKTVWTFHINPKAVFSDGSPITAADVKGTWEIQIQPVNNVGRIQGYLGNTVGFAEAREEGSSGEVSGIKVVDEHTIEVSLINPDPVFHWNIATCHLPAIKVAQYKQYDWDTYWLPENNPVFSGPFVLDAYDPDLNTAELVRNPNWWMDEGPYLDRITFMFVTDTQTRGAMIKNDQADASLGDIPLHMMDEYPGMFREQKQFGFNLFWLDSKAPPTDDLNVRKALALSVDWEQAFAAAFPLAGTGVPTPNLIDPDIPCQDKEHVWYEYDVEVAKAALAASKYGSAENLPKLRVTPRGTNPAQVNALEAVMGFWRENLGIVNIEWKQQPDEWVEEDQVLINLSRDDVFVRYPDAATYMWKCAHSEGQVASGGLLGGYKNEKVDALLDEALGIDPDDPRRCELALEAQRVFMDDYHTLAFGQEVMRQNVREYVKNMYRGPDVGVVEPWKIKIEK